MKIYGKIITDPKEWEAYHGTNAIPGCSYYALGLEKNKFGIYRRGISGCSGRANQLLGRSYHNPDDTMSWGFEGNGSDLTAAWLIAGALYYETWGAIMGESECIAVRFSHNYVEILPVIQSHYKQFSTEVIASLPDEWEMDTAWIKAWIMDKEAVPV